MDEAQLHMLMDSHYKKPDNLKEFWAKLKKFIEVKEKLMIIPRRDLLLKYVLKHKNILTVDHIRSVFRFDKLLKLIHEDMDWCKRAHLAGYDVVYYPECVVEYKGTRAARRSWKYAKIHIKSLLTYWRKFGIMG